jgi:hypothetical protein
MRYLDLSEFKPKAVPTPFSQVGEVLLRNRYRRHWPHPQFSVRLYATMLWPNVQRRSQFLDAFTARYGRAEQSTSNGLQDDGSLLIAGRRIMLRELGSQILDHLDDDLEAAQMGLRNTGDIMLTLARLDANPYSVIRGGPSISKAKEVIEASKGGPNRQRLEADWSKYRDVAHLAAATSFLSSIGVKQSGNSCPITLLTPVFADPGTLLCIALKFQEFGLSFRPMGRKQSVLPSETIWRIPVSDQVSAAHLDLGPLDADAISVLQSRRARRD